MLRTLMLWLCATCALQAASPSVFSIDQITLQDALEQALSSDEPLLQVPMLEAEASLDLGTADSQLPDPKVRLAAANLPTDGFSFTQEPMTQMQIGVTQAFPRGKTRSIRREQRSIIAEGFRRQQDLLRREIVRSVQTAWLQARFADRALDKIRASRSAVADLISALEADFGSGGVRGQAIYRAQVELSLLDDRLAQFEQRRQSALSRLTRWVPGAEKAVAAGPVTMRHPPERQALLEMLDKHPQVLVEQARADQAATNISLARQHYKPGWSVSVGYGRRGGERADFATVGVTVDVPLFTAKRQDMRVSAAKKKRQAALATKDSQIRDMAAAASELYTSWVQLQQRATLYETVVQVRAAETAEASLSAYQNGVIDFPELIRARLALLDTEITLLSLELEKYTAQAGLLYFTGDADE